MPTTRAKTFFSSESSRPAPILILLLLACGSAFGLAWAESNGLLVKAYYCSNKPCTKTSQVSLPSRNSVHRVDVYLKLHQGNRKLQLALFCDGEMYGMSQPLERELNGINDLPVYSWPFRGLPECQYLAAAQVVRVRETVSATARFSVGPPPD